RLARRARIVETQDSASLRSVRVRVPFTSRRYMLAQAATTYVAGLARSAIRPPWRVIGVLTVLELLGAFGNAWDLFWHIAIGRDSFWIPPHTMMYAAVALSGL